MRVRFAENAENDLVEIGRYIAQDSLENAIKFVDKLETTCHETLSDYPEMGRKCDDLVEGLRVFPVANYLVFYRINDACLEVVRILNAARDVESIFSRHP